MSWLIPSVIATTAGTAILTACYGYVYALDRKPYLKVWTLSWAVYFVRYMILLVMLFRQKTPYLLIGNQVATLVSGILLLYGSYLFIGKKFPRVFVYMAVAGILWIFISILNQYSFLVMSLPTFSFLAYIYIRTGLIFLNASPSEKKEAAVVGTGFIIWGIHKADYPFLQPVAWFAPWGYLFAALIEFTVALGLLLVYFRKTRNELQGSNDRFRLAFMTSPDSINLNRVEDGMYLEINDGFTKIMGYTREEVVGKSSLDLNIWADPGDRDRLVSGLKQYGVVENLEAVFQGKDGCIKTGLMSARILKIGNDNVILSITRDITERKQMEADRERWLTAIEQIAEGIVITDPGGTIEYVNPSFEKMTGYSSRELMGKNPRILKSGKQDESFYQSMWETLASGRIWNDKIINKKKDGSFYIEDTRISPVFDGSRKITHFVAVKRDITEELRMEEKFQQSQKMEAIGTLAGGIAHDFNNILFPIVGHTEMLLEDLPEDSEDRNSLQEIYTGALRARDLVQQILAFARQEKSELKLMKMQPIIKEALKLIRSTIPTTISMQQNLDPGCGAVKADPTQIHQIVMNLATNAYHAMEEGGGELSVKLKQILLGEHDLIHPDMTPGAYACLTVADTGMGMNRDVISRIFDPFFTTKGQGKGTGMGLSVVHGIVNRMNGAIQVYSEPGQGTEFRVYLPIAGIPAEKRDFSTNEPLPTGCEKILLVDDEEAIIKMEKQILERLGYQVTSRTSSIEAVEAFRTDPYRFDLVMSDMAMPQMPGDKLAVELIRIRPDIPILLCTGFSESMTEDKIKNIGVRGIVLKPIIMKDLARKIREVLDV
ncbi:MAG: PAS domain S-box protein [Desulfobacula sp.]|jgi:PAS domain S-box-containing protein